MTEQFIEKAKLKHCDKYDYSKVEYIKANDKVIIICREHGEFLQTPQKHLSGGCILCGYLSITNNKELFILKSKKIHDDKYDYSQVEYINNNINVKIICKEHGEFLQLPRTHLSGSGCTLCKIKNLRKRLISNKDEFIEKAKEKHGNKYDYNKVEYIDSKTKVIIICKKHSEFLQTPTGHLSGNGCIICKNNATTERFRSDTKEFIVKAKKIHDDNYDYSKVEYIDSKTKVIIICKKHGEFKIIPNSHLQPNNSGCIICSGKTYNNETFIEKSKKIHGDKYDYSKVEYKNCNEKIIIICKIHGEFLQKPHGHFNGGCTKCAGCCKNTSDEFIEKAIQIHGNNYDYSKVKYENAKTKVIVICKKHGEFKIVPNSHLRYTGCGKCKNKTEGKLHNIITKYYPTIIYQFKKEWCKNENNNMLLFDFCIPEYNIIIELDGLQHFKQVRNWSSPEEQNKSDKFKEKCANDNNYSIIRLLQEDVFNDKYNWLDELKNNIEKIKNENIIQNIYMCKNNEYDIFVNN